MNVSLKFAVLCLTLTFISCSQTSSKQKPDLSIGIIADCQYHPREHRRERHYNLSATKLEQAVSVLNDEPIDWSIHLGDFIDKDYDSYQTLLPIWQTLKSPGYHALGNHDFSVKEELKLTVPNILNMPSRYYDFEQGNWRFVIIDGNDLSLYAYPKDSEQHRISEASFQSLKQTSPSYKELHTYNGALGNKQITWLEGVLDDANSKGQQVVLFSHFPIYLMNEHNLWNDAAVINLLEQYSGVFAWFNGHNHVGNYGFKNGIHYVTFKAMVNTKENAFSVADFYPDKIEIIGHGREKNMILPRGEKARTPH